MIGRAIDRLLSSADGVAILFVDLFGLMSSHLPATGSHAPIW